MKSLIKTSLIVFGLALLVCLITTTINTDTKLSPQNTIDNGVGKLYTESNEESLYMYS